jgi:hypothetical protein
MSAMVGHFKEKNGIIEYIITGTKDEIEEIIKEIRDMGHQFDETPNIIHVHRGQWSVLLKIKVPIRVGGND